MDYVPDDSVGGWPGVGFLAGNNLHLGARFTGAGTHHREPGAFGSSHGRQARVGRHLRRADDGDKAAAAAAGSQAKALPRRQCAHCHRAALEAGCRDHGRRAGTLIAHAIRLEDRVQTVFNVSQIMLKAGVGAAIFVAFGVGLDGELASGLEAVGPIIVAGLAMFVANYLMVATMIAFYEESRCFTSGIRPRVS